MHTIENGEQKRNPRWNLLPYLLGAAALVAVLGFGIYALKQGWLGVRPQPTPARPVQGMDGTPAKIGRAHV